MSTSVRINTRAYTCDEVLKRNGGGGNGKVSESGRKIHALIHCDADDDNDTDDAERTR